jgi:predicted aminopeptidase
VADHPVKVPPELVQQWRVAAANSTAASQLGTAHARQDHFIEYIADRAGQWGADQELEACCEWVGYPVAARQLRAARRPKPPTLAEQGLEALRSTPCTEQRHYDAMFAALTRLAKLEAQQ